MFSGVALPAALAHLSPRLIRVGSAYPSAAEATGPEKSALPFGFEELDSLLPDHGLLRGGVVELAISGRSGLATTLALGAVRACQTQSKLGFGASKKPWCAFVDPTSTLYAPGVAASGVELERLLVVRPPVEALSRVALKLAESGVFELVVIDTVGTLGSSQAFELGRFGRVVRRLSMAVDGTDKSVLLLTDAEQPRALPLPVAQRIELTRRSTDRLLLRVAKDRRGRVSAQRPIAWTRGSPVEEATEGPTHAQKLA